MITKKDLMESLAKKFRHSSKMGWRPTYLDLVDVLTVLSLEENAEKLLDKNESTKRSIQENE